MEIHGLQQEPLKILRLDKQGRVSLGKLAEGVDTYQVFHGKDDELVLKPFVDIPAKQAWLFNNPEALSSVLRGAREVEEGKGETLELDELK